jgi:hypothetical protein
MLKVFNKLYSYYGYDSELYIQPHNVLEEGGVHAATIAADENSGPAE